MSQARALSSDEVQHLRDELAAGRTPTVWFTPSAVGVPEGRSGKVTALGEVEEGDFVQVRPASSQDVLSFSATEITLDRPPRKRKDDTGSGTASSAKASGSPARTSGTAKTSGAAKTSSTTTASAKTSSARAESAQTGSAKTGARNSAASQQNRSADAERTGRSTGTAEKSGTAQKSGHGQKSADSEKSGNAEQSGSSQKSRQAGSNAESKRKPRSINGATVTLTADENGQWHVEVNTGKKRTLRPKTVSASAVAHAAKALHEDVAAAVEPLLETAREQQRVRVEQLQRELADAQRTLDDLAE